MNETIKM